MTDWGVPDWRVPDAYPSSHAELSAAQWWWEFTRRNHRYRALWQQFRPHDDASGGLSLDPSTVDELRHKFRTHELLNPKRSLPASELQYARVRRVSYHRPQPGDYLSAARVVEKHGWDTAEAIARSQEEHAARRRDEGYQSVTFDLSRPLKPQIKDAERVLEALQLHRFGKVRRNPNEHMWPLYLRVLDARDANATLLEIGREFWPGLETACGDTRERAQIDKAKTTHRNAARVRDSYPD